MLVGYGALAPAENNRRSHRELAATLGQATHVVVEGAGHDLFLASPEVVARIVAFLAGREVSAAPIVVAP